MEMLRRSSVFAAEVFDRSPTDKELVSQAKALCRDYIHSRLNHAGIGWSRPEQGVAASGGKLAEVSLVVQWLGESVMRVWVGILLGSSPEIQLMELELTWYIALML